MPDPFRDVQSFMKTSTGDPREQRGQPRMIVGFHQDALNEWVADLACGHTQHVRHRPPWELRPWVITEEGRRQHVGTVLLCKKCEETLSPSLIKLGV